MMIINYIIQYELFDVSSGVGASGTPVPIEILKIWLPLGTGYRANFGSWVPLGTGYRANLKRWVPLGTGKRQNFRTWVQLGTGYR